MAGNNDNATQNQQPPTPPAPQSVTPPSPAPNLPAPTAGTPTLAPQPPAPSTVQPPAAAAQPAAQQPHPLARALDAVLKTATGGDVYYTDPNTGEQRIAPQSRGTLGKTLIAATLAGMLAPDKYRDTPFGPVRDYSGSATSAFERSNEVMQRARQRPEQLSEQQRTAKLHVLENNYKAFQLHTAQWQFKQNQYEANKATIDATNSALQEYEDNRDTSPEANQPKAWMAQGQTVEQLLAGGHKLTDSNVYQDGKTPDGNPTYAVINPALQNITLTKEQTDLLKDVNSSYENIHAVVGGKVTVPMSTFISGMHDVAMINSGLDWINQLNAAEGVNGDKAKEIQPGDYKKALRSNPQMLKAMWGLTHKNAQGYLPDQNADTLLNQLAVTPGGAGVLDLMGLTPEEAKLKAQDIEHKRTAAETLAKFGYTDKAPADPNAWQSLIDAVAKAPQNVQDEINPLLKDEHPTRGTFARVQRQFQSAMQNDRRVKLTAGDPATMTESAQNMIMGDTTDVKDMMSARNNVRQTFGNLLQEQAASLGLPRDRYTLSFQKARNDKFQEYSSDDKGKVGGQIVAFDKMLGHFNESYQANLDWTRSNSPLLNKPITWLDKNATNNQDYQRFQTSIIAPLKEYINLLNQGRAEQQKDGEDLAKIINDTMTPAQVMTSLKTLAQTADVQMSSLGRRYLETVGNTYPVVTPTGASILETLLGKGKSQAAKLAKPIPRGWQQVGGKLMATPLTDQNIARQIVEDSGNDRALSIRNARENGWQVPD